MTMNRDFEFRQLLRAYRSGIITEETFEHEMAELEGTSMSNGTGGFRAFGKTYATEREAIIAFIDRARVAEANAGVAFNNWAKVCKTDCIRSGLRMIAERESYHGRMFEQRLRDMGSECQATVSEQSRQFSDTVSDANLSDNEKLLRFNMVAIRMRGVERTGTSLAECTAFRLTSHLARRWEKLSLAAGLKTVREKRVAG